MHPPEVLGVGAQQGFQVSEPRTLMEVRAHPGALCLCAQAAKPLIRVHAHQEFSVVGAQSANLGAHQPGSGRFCGCLSRVHSPGAEGGGAPEATDAAESSLNRR